MMMVGQRAVRSSDVSQTPSSSRGARVDAHSGFAPEDQLEWELACPDAITSDTIWKLHVYRTALYLLYLSRMDVRLGMKRRLNPELTGQLLGSVASISANIGEGYSRSTRGDRLRFFGYALGSLRESVSWYFAVSDFLPPNTCDDRLRVIARIRPLLLGLIRSTRARSQPRHEFEA
jgi:four helix bundle protein